MPRLNISNLPYPAAAYDPEFSTERDDGVIQFPSIDAAIAEDEYRAKECRRLATSSDDSSLGTAARALGRKLGTGRIHDTLASAVYMRDQQKKLAGALWKLLREVDSQFPDRINGHVATVMRRDWELTIDELESRDPRSFTERFRVDLYNAGAGSCGGGILYAIHGEADHNCKRFSVHLHAFALGQMVEVLERVRKGRGYAPITRFVDGHQKTIPAITISRERLYNVPYPLTYRLQWDWWSRWEGYKRGEFVRGSKCRIPEPDHTRILVWLDRFKLPDIVGMIGMRVCPSGLVLNRELYTKTGVRSSE